MTIGPKSVIIVGGSLAGLMHGVYFKRRGTDVVILEQDPNPIRGSHQAGIAIGPAVEEFLTKYDKTGVQSCTPPMTVRLAFRKQPETKRLLKSAGRNQTSWGLLYRILRANFDGMASDAVPNPPSAREEGEGRVQYYTGQRVTRLEYDRDKQVVSATFVDQGDGKEDTMTADLVIGAYGGRSTVRTLLENTYFENQFTLSFLKKSYIVSYNIPPDTPSFTPGTRLINWVWYSNVDEASPAMAEILTDIHNRLHGNTMPAGLVRPEVWNRQVANTLPHMAGPLAELISATHQTAVFVTKVHDALCQAPVLCDGKVILVGETLAAFRPHFALATEQAARHCLALAKVQEGEKSLDQWAREARVYGKRMWLASRLLGMFGWAGGGSFSNHYVCMSRSW